MSGLRSSAGVLAVLVLASGCGEQDPVPSPTPLAPAPITSPPVLIGRPIAVGEVIQDALTSHGMELLFEVAAPTNGTLTVKVGLSGCAAAVAIDDRWFGCDASGLTATAAAVAGRKYLLRVADAAPWDYGDLYLPFTLTTSISQ